MDHSEIQEIQEKLYPGLGMALDKTLSYREIRDICQIAVVHLAIKREGNQERAARKLGMSNATVSHIVNGKTHQHLFREGNK